MVRSFGFFKHANPQVTNTRRSCAVLTVTLIGFSSLVFAWTPPPPPATYPIKIAIQGGQVMYDINGNDVRILHANNLETVTWEGKPSTGSSHRITILFPFATPFVNSSGQPVYVLHGDQTQGPLGNNIKISSTAFGTYKYCVAVLNDDGTPTTFADDPKIIIGRGNEFKAELLDIGADLSHVKEEIQDLENRIKELADKLPADVPSGK